MDICQKHNIAWAEFNKEGKTWYSHKNTDGSWCNRSKVEAESKPTSQDPEARRSYRIERQHSQHMALIDLTTKGSYTDEQLKARIDFFHKDLDEK